jgi:hypothetical protein
MEYFKRLHLSCLFLDVMFEVLRVNGVPSEQTTPVLANT